MKKIVFIFLILSITYLAYRNFSDKPNFQIHLNFIIPDSLNYLISIKNNNNYSVNFNFSLNNKFYNSINHFIQQNIKHSQSDEQKVISLFNALTSSLVNHKLFDNWGTLPLVRLNSLGFALCGNQSQLFCYILNENGYRTRIIELNGHVVSEVYFNNSWKFFDTNRETFFKQNDSILSYEQLLKIPQLIKKIGNKNKMANLCWQFDTYPNYLISQQDNKVIPQLNNKHNDTFLINLPPKASFIFPYLPDIKNDIHLYNTKAKLFLPKGFNDEVVNPLVLIDVEGKGIVKYNKQYYSIPEQKNLLKIKIFSSNQFIDKIHVKVFSDSLALVYMLNPIFSTLQSNNYFSLNASDSLKILLLKNKYDAKTNIRPIHLEFLNHYTNKTYQLMQKLNVEDINTTHELYNNQLKKYCIENNIDTVTVKKRLMLLQKILTKPISSFRNESALYGYLTVILYGTNEEFKHLYLSKLNYLLYRKIIKKMK